MEAKSECACGGDTARKECACGGAKHGGEMETPSPVYALGRIHAEPGSPGVEKEFLQALAGTPVAEGTLPDIHGLLAARKNRYLARAFRWVLRGANGEDRLVLAPMDSLDLDLLLEAIDPAAANDTALVIGVTGPVGATARGPVRMALVEHLYAFRQSEVAKRMGADVPAEVVDGLWRLTGNSGMEAGCRALNYLLTRYAGIYQLAAARAKDGYVLSAVDMLPADNGPGRVALRALLTFTHPPDGGGLRDSAVVDVTERFPYLVSEFAPHVMTGWR